MQKLSETSWESPFAGGAVYPHSSKRAAVLRSFLSHLDTKRPFPGVFAVHLKWLRRRTKRLHGLVPMKQLHEIEIDRLMIRYRCRAGATSSPCRTPALTSPNYRKQSTRLAERQVSKEYLILLNNR